MQVHRFHHSAALSLKGKGETRYLSADEAERAGRALLAIAGSIRTEGFAQSGGLTVAFKSEASIGDVAEPGAQDPGQDPASADPRPLPASFMRHNGRQPPTRFDYSRWRHGGWYVSNVRYDSGAVGCVSNNYTDRKWRIACDPRPFEEQPTFRTRDEAALAEWHWVNDHPEPGTIIHLPSPDYGPGMVVNERGYQYEAPKFPNIEAAYAALPEGCGVYVAHPAGCAWRIIETTTPPQA